MNTLRIITLTSIFAILAQATEEVNIKRWNWLINHNIIEGTTPFDGNEKLRDVFIEEYCMEIRTAYDKTKNGIDIGWPGDPLSTDDVEGDLIRTTIFESLYVNGKNIREIVKDIIYVEFSKIFTLDREFDIEIMLNQALITTTLRNHELLKLIINNQ